MSETFTATIEGGVLKPKVPLGLPEGRELELAIVRLVPSPEEDAADAAAFEKALDDWYEAAAECSPEWWDDFERELRENRMNFEERF